jgi:REP element-mobilizing transposase RayT
MARLPRLKVENEIGWYHLCARVAGWLNWFPFEDRIARQKLLETIRKYLAVYCCDAAAFCLMGNHYHLVVRFLPFRILPPEELDRRARLLYRDPDQVLRSRRQWQRFNRRIFDVSEFMRNVQQSYTKWYNRRYQRRGALWGERFKSVILGEEASILETLLYVELNPVRAGQVQRPEDWQWSSAALRALSQDDWLIPLEELIPEVPPSQLSAYYRELLYQRGAVATKPGTGTIPLTILRLEEARGFCQPGAYLRRLRFFSDGLFLGSRIQVEDWITELRRRGHYARRKHTIQQKVNEAIFHTLREQRMSPLRS